MTAKAIVLASSLLLVALGARAESVGNVGAVNQSARGTPPGGAGRTLSVGLGVQKRERIETGASGTAQIVFRDTSTMTVGRNSSVTIDDFVYNASAGAGKQGVSMAKGVMRFVGGGVSHTDGVQVKTPTASIGLRGGTAYVQIGGACGTLFALLNGVGTAANSAESRTLTSPGYAVCVPANAPISEPFLAPPEMMANLTQLTSSAPGQSGGAATPPNNRHASRSLGVNRPPNDVDGPGLDVLNQEWGGSALVQSRANANNQPFVPPPQQREGYDTGFYEGYSNGVGVDY